MKVWDCVSKLSSHKVSDTKTIADLIVLLCFSNFDAPDVSYFKTHFIKTSALVKFQMHCLFRSTNDDPSFNQIHSNECHWLF